MVIVDHFPSDAAGAPIPGIPWECSLYEMCQARLLGSEWAPFQSQHDWEFARWVKSTGVTSTAVSNLLAIPEVCSISIQYNYVTKSWLKVADNLGLSYYTVPKLNSIIDSELPGQLPF
jgi:hypothetical protein